MGLWKSNYYIENPYNDQWIKNFKKNQKNVNKNISAANKAQSKAIKTQKAKNEKQQKAIAGLDKDIKAAEKKLKNKVGTTAFQEYKDKQKDKLGDIGDQISALETKETKIGDVTGLDKYLTTLSENLTDVEGKAATKTALDDLQTALAGGTFQIGEDGQTIGDIQSALAAAEGNLSTLTDDFSGLQEDLGDLETTLKADYGSQISDLSDEFDVDLEKVYAKFDEEKQAFEDYQTKAAQDLSDVQTALQTQFGEGYDELTSGLEDLKLATDQQFLDVYKTGEEAIADLDEKFAGQLQDTSASLQEKIAESEAATETKLGQVAALQNYRMIGDSAGGIKMRRSKAYKSGAVNMGTGQLSRSMKLQTLNL